MKWYAVLFALNLLLHQQTCDVEAIGITASVAGIAALIGGGWISKDAVVDVVNDKVLCYYECCDLSGRNHWIDFNPKFEELERKLFGQHIAVALVKRSIRQHLKKDNPSKALVLSLHGFTGVGKNYLSKLVARAIYKQFAEKEDSNYVHTLVATHFISNDFRADQYRLKTFVENGINKCERSLFIIDEVDKFPEKFLDVLIPYIESNNKFNGASYNKAIFLLLGNSGGDSINTKTNELRDQGISRDQIPVYAFDSILNSKAAREGGLKNSDLINRGIIDLFVPFLPLEREHVKQCIEEYLREHRNFTEPYDNPGRQFIENVADQISYIPDTDVYSRFGCKRVPITVDVLIADD